MWNEILQKIVSTSGSDIVWGFGVSVIVRDERIGVENVLFRENKSAMWWFLFFIIKSLIMHSNSEWVSNSARLSNTRMVWWLDGWWVRWIRTGTKWDSVFVIVFHSISFLRNGIHINCNFDIVIFPLQLWFLETHEIIVLNQFQLKLKEIK